MTMTREEAIKELAVHLVHWKRLKNEHIVPTDECENTINALRMAIEALQFAEHFDLLKEYQSLQEVVRCEDCEHKITCAKTVNMTKTGSNSIASWVQPLDFCSYGERREE